MTEAVASLVAHARVNSLGDILRRTARRYPDKTALIAGQSRWTYSEFDSMVNRTANALVERGIAKSDRLAILSHNSWQFVILSFSAARVGAVLVPINFMLTSHEVSFILEHSAAKGVLAEDALIPVAHEAILMSGINPIVRGSLCLATETAPTGWESVERWARHPDDREPSVRIEEDDPIRLMYTSGTEARPKGALLTSRSLIAQYVSCVVDGAMERDDVEIHALPMYHCAQLDCFFGPDVYLGATSVILPRPAPDLLLSAVSEHRATKLFCPPTVWISLLRSPSFDRTDLSSLRKGYYGASPMPVQVLKELQDRLPHVQLWNFYGQTEMAPVATILGPSDQLSRAGSAGRAVLNVETKLIDDQGREVAPGMIGEIVHRSPQATIGYFQDEKATEEAFREGWFHSGDLGVMSTDGYLTVVDRKKDMIKTGGENVASREVEETIYQLPGVAEVAVFAVPDETWIEAVTAAVVPRDDQRLTSEDILGHCRGVLAGYKVPKHVLVLEALPKNPSGKTLKRELREKYADLGERGKTTQT
jgi:fatty-acyl-CoA synthase